jgi:hypothetical protein
MSIGRVECPRRNADMVFRPTGTPSKPGANRGPKGRDSRQSQTSQRAVPHSPQTGQRAMITGKRLTTATDESEPQADQSRGRQPADSRHVPIRSN